MNPLDMFPQLTAGLGQSAKLLKQLSFDEIHDLARLQAKEGNEAVRRQFANIISDPLRNK